MKKNEKKIEKLQQEEEQEGLMQHPPPVDTPGMYRPAVIADVNIYSSFNQLYYLKINLLLYIYYNIDQKNFILSLVCFFRW